MSAKGPGPKVTVYEIQDRRTTKDGAPTGKTRPWIVRWKVGTALPSQAFTHRAAARAFHSRLVVAAADGERFSTETLLPVSWAVSTLTVAEWAHQWMRSQWGRWSPRQRASVAEVLAAALPLLVGSRGNVPTDDVTRTALRRSIKEWLASESVAMPSALRHSLLLSDLTSVRCETANAILLQRADGRMLARNTANRNRTVMRSMIAAAVKAELIDTQVWPGAPQSPTKSEKKGRSGVVDTANLPSWALLRTLLPKMVNHQPSSKDFYVSACLMAYLGLRPSEAVAARIETLVLPVGEGWGTLLVERARQDAGELWTEAGEEEGPTKTAIDRAVPVPPMLVEILREHIGDRTRGYITVTRKGEPLDINHVRRSWQRVQGGQVQWDLYDLRHTAATEMLQSGAPIGEVARRMGHSVDTLTKVYVGVLEGDEVSANARIEGALT